MFPLLGLCFALTNVRRMPFEMSGMKLRVVQALLSFLTAVLEDLAL